MADRTEAEKREARLRRQDLRQEMLTAAMSAPAVLTVVAGYAAYRSGVKVVDTVKSGVDLVYMSGAALSEQRGDNLEPAYQDSSASLSDRAKSMARKTTGLFFNNADTAHAMTTDSSEDPTYRVTEGGLGPIVHAVDKEGHVIGIGPVSPDFTIMPDNPWAMGHPGRAAVEEARASDVAHPMFASEAGIPLGHQPGGGIDQ